MLSESLFLNDIPWPWRRKLATPHFYKSNVFIQNTKIINTQGETVLVNFETKLTILSEKESKHTKATRKLTHRMRAQVGNASKWTKEKLFMRWLRYSPKAISIILIKHHHFSFCFFLCNCIISRMGSRIKSSDHLLAMLQQCISWIYCPSCYLDCIFSTFFY